MKATSVVLFALLLFSFACNNGRGKGGASQNPGSNASTGSSASDGNAQKGQDSESARTSQGQPGRKSQAGADTVGSQGGDQEGGGVLPLNPNFQTASVKGSCGGRPCDGHPLDGPPLMRKGHLNWPRDKWSKVNLDPAEEASLKTALAETQTHGRAENLHIHADVIDGKLKFSPDRDHDEHVSGNEPEVAVGDAAGGTKTVPVKVKASPVAMKAINARVAPH